MRFMVIVKANKDSEAGKMPTEEMLTKMGKFNEELAKAGVMLAGEGLHHCGIQATGLEELELARQQGDELGRQLRLQHLARVRLEGERHGARVLPRLGEEGLMADMNSVEVAQRDR